MQETKGSGIGKLVMVSSVGGPLDHDPYWILVDAFTTSLKI